MTVTLRHHTWIFNDTETTVVLSLDGQYEYELRPGQAKEISEFNRILNKDRHMILRQNPDEKVEIGHQAPENSVHLKSDDPSSFTISYRATETEVKTVRFGW